MPTLGYQPRRSNPLARVLVTSLVVGGLSGGAWYLWKGRLRQEAPATPAPRAALPAAPDAGTLTAAALAPEAPPEPKGPTTVTVRLRGPLETALVEQVGEEVGPALSQVVTRALVWWVRVPQELLVGDTIEVVFEPREMDEPLLHAVRFTSNKMGKTFAAYRFQARGDAFPRYYQPDGTELEMRLEGSPMDDYEQVTSLLRDGRRHKGVDFKAPVGSPVKAPFSGTITRRNWNWRYNGNSIELSDGRGRKALFLHLDELPQDIKVGTRVRAGQVIARSGNSGRSFAPHLHYQLMQGDSKVLDPFDIHKTFRRSLSAGTRAAFDTEVRRLDGLLGAATAAATAR
jgi:murein DD-endopeptidase MepM/ murein hydrolase activator NlpD